ncbi:YqgE/AlgH family protein [Tessaracoccus defluvii]|uniref:YqgE/AlgH family protein n=1 Tax=Tessaracoccus defluvii TaxID=1285901 RepID=A0A7H0H8P3_9ACTN|nr:YqgE/AlgH family protein [Tessaracoccus defluvii]QNP56909.1 YqgE/AlgH family protein [Tessaracoccus defluvii]
MEQTGEIAAGQLLIATQPGRSGYFDRTVILLLDHRPMGTVGVTLNVASDIDVAEALPTLVPHLRPLPGIWEGDPSTGRSSSSSVRSPLATPHPQAGSGCSATSASST